nr:MAG TPA: hypothetical protein [Bacteriophage sp.]
MWYNDLVRYAPMIRILLFFFRHSDFSLVSTTQNFPAAFRQLPGFSVL